MRRHVWRHANTLLGKQVHQEWAGPVVFASFERVVLSLVLLHTVQVGIEQVAAVEWASLRLWVELGAENGSALVDHALVRAIVEVGEVLLELVGQSGRINRVSVVLRSDVALASHQVQSGDVVSTVTVLHLDRLGTCGSGKKLMSETDTHDGDVAGIHELLQVVARLAAVGWVTRSVGDEDTVKVVRSLVDGVVPWQAGHAGTAAHNRTDDVLLDATVDESNVRIAFGRRYVEWCLGGDFGDQVDSRRVVVCLVLIRVVLLAHRNLAERRTLLSQVRHNSTGVDTGDGRDTLASTPVRETLHGGPVRVLECSICHNDTTRLNVGALEVLEQSVLVTSIGWHTVVADEGLSEDQNLSTVGRISHRLGISHQRCGEHSLSTDACLGTEALSVEDGAIADGEGGSVKGWLGRALEGVWRGSTNASLWCYSGIVPGECLAEAGLRQASRLEGSGQDSRCHGGGCWWSEERAGFLTTEGFPQVVTDVVCHVCQPLASCISHRIAACAKSRLWCVCHTLRSEYAGRKHSRDPFSTRGWLWWESDVDGGGDGEKGEFSSEVVVSFPRVKWAAGEVVP